jgi:hypothetical protein
MTQSDWNVHIDTLLHSWGLDVPMYNTCMFDQDKETISQTVQHISTSQRSFNKVWRQSGSRDSFRPNCACQNTVYIGNGEHFHKEKLRILLDCIGVQSEFVNYFTAGQQIWKNWYSNRLIKLYYFFARTRALFYWVSPNVLLSQFLNKFSWQ